MLPSLNPRPVYRSAASENLCGLAWRRSLTLVLTFAPTLAVLAAPDAGSLQQQQQQEREQLRTLPQQTAPLLAEPAAPGSPKRGSALEVKGFKFRGNTLLSSAQLEQVLESYGQRVLDFGEIESLTNVLTASYRANGYLASVVLPAQDVSDGFVTFLVQEAVVGKVQADAQPDARTHAQRVQALVAAQLPTGQPFRVQPLDRALLLANDLPGVTVTGALAEGASGRQTDLVLRVTDKPAFTGDAAADNAGGLSTGTNRLSVNLYGNSPLGMGELFSASVVANQGSTYARWGLTVPVGYDGLRLGLNGSRLDYRVVAADFASQHLEGSSGVLGLEAVYPLVRSQRLNLYFSAALDNKAFLNYSGGAAVSDYGNRAINWSLYGNRFDDFAGGGSTTANLTLTQGHLVLDAYAAHAADAATVQTAGDYRKLRYTLARQQFVTEDLALLASWSGQWTDQNLDSSEKFGLGGSTGVRAYSGSDGSGAIGQLFSTELRWRWSDALALSAFYDAGSVTINARNGYVGASALNAYSLSGAGLALAWQWDSRVSLKLSWAHRLGDNPNPAANGSDQDGTLVLDRVWASASVMF